MKNGCFLSFVSSTVHGKALYILIGKEEKLLNALVDDGHYIFSCIKLRAY